jgi:hypothetical protein
MVLIMVNVAAGYNALHLCTSIACILATQYLLVSTGRPTSLFKHLSFKLSTF